MLGEGQLIRELKLRGVNLNERRKWVKNDVHTTKGGGYYFKPASKI
jgi:hypothetical protein